MLGAILGDVIGSVYEWNNIKTTEFPLFNKKCRPTDDSIMTIAVADGLMRAWDEDDETIKKSIVSSMQYYGRKFPLAGYGGRFHCWLNSSKPEPYNSWGNGSAMRVSSVGWLFDNLPVVEAMAALTAEVTHNHPEGIKGAQVIAACIFLARAHCDKDIIRTYIERRFDYNLGITLAQTRPRYSFDVSCQGSVPQAVRAFLEGSSYEEVVRLAISIGGDSDTIACMAGAIAEAYYGIPEDIKKEGLVYIDEFLKGKIYKFRKFYHNNCQLPDRKTILEQIDWEHSIDNEYWIREDYSEYIESRRNDFGLEEQVRINIKEKPPKHIQAFISSVAAPSSVDEIEHLINNEGEYNVETLLHETSTSWTVPKWAKHGDIVFFMHTRTARSSLTADRTELNKQKNLYSSEEYDEILAWINRGLQLHQTYGGKIYAVGQVYGNPIYDDFNQTGVYHWTSHLYADIDNLVVLKNPVDLSEFNDFLQISKGGGITPVYGDDFRKLKRVIADKNVIPDYFEGAEATPLPLSKVNQENWMTIANEFRRAFILETQFRKFYVDYLLKAIADRKKIFSECRCVKTGQADSFVDNMIFIKGKYLPVEVKLSVPAQADIRKQVRKYCYDDAIFLEKGEQRPVYQAKVHEGKCLIIDTDFVYMYDYETDIVSNVADLDSICNEKDAESLKRTIENLL